MKKPTFGPMILAAIFLIVVLLIPGLFANAFIGEKQLDKAATSLDPRLFQGVTLEKKMLADKKYLPMYGSSELLRLDQYHPSNYFKVNNDGFTPFLIGRGGTQSLVQFLNLAATAKELDHRKVVFILSPQWFTKQGLDEKHFAPNFSKLQAYDLIFNREIDPALKRRAAKRLLDFKFIRDDRPLSYLLADAANDNGSNKLKKFAVMPYAYGTYKVLEWQDALNALSLHPRRPNIDPELKGLSWKKLHHEADLTGERLSTSNPYGITNKYYNKKIRKKIKTLAGYRSHERYDQSPEYGDLQLILDLFKAHHTKVLFISVPVNGRWYDFAGVPKQARDVYYRKVCEQIEAAGFQVADFSGHEYDKYFLKDTMHLGWKGWVYVDHAIKNFYDQN